MLAQPHFAQVPQASALWGWGGGAKKRDRVDWRQAGRVGISLAEFALGSHLSCVWFEHMRRGIAALAHVVLLRIAGRRCARAELAPFGQLIHSSWIPFWMGPNKVLRTHVLEPQNELAVLILGSWVP